MDKTRPAAERVRPILEAMERSIDAARRHRTHVDDVPETATSPVPAVPREPDVSRADEPPRLKARPKRPLAIPSLNGLPGR